MISAVEMPRSWETSLTDEPDGTFTIPVGTTGAAFSSVRSWPVATAAARAAAALGAGAAARGAGVDDDAAALAAGRRGTRPARRAGGRRRIGALDGLLVYADLAVDDLDARLLEVGEHVVDAGAALRRDLRDLASLRHSPHHLSSAEAAGPCWVAPAGPRCSCSRRTTSRRTAGSTFTGPRKARANARRFCAASRHCSAAHR